MHTTLSTTRTTEPKAMNLYALPDGQVLNLADHCTDDVERFTLRDRSLVWAVRVGAGTPEAAVARAKEMLAAENVAKLLNILSCLVCITDSADRVDAEDQADFFWRASPGATLYWPLPENPQYMAQRF